MDMMPPIWPWARLAIQMMKTMNSRPEDDVRQQADQPVGPRRSEREVLAAQVLLQHLDLIGVLQRRRALGLVDVPVGVRGTGSRRCCELTCALLTWPFSSSVRNWLYLTVGGAVADITLDTSTASTTTAMQDHQDPAP